MIFDTHAHYDDEQYNDDRDELFQQFLEHGITKVVNIATSLEVSKNNIAMSEKYPFLYGTIGIFPSETNNLPADAMERLMEYAKEPKIVAVGEVGLDYHYPDTNKEVQQEWFCKQLDVARKSKLPVCIHSRDAAKDTLDIMKDENADQIGGVIHCYSYSVDMAKEYLDMGFYFGIGGVLTFKNGKKLRQVVDYIPLSHIVLETDAPYLAPEPYRGTRNQSLNLSLVIDKIAEIKGVTKQEVEEVTYHNACRMYEISE